MRNYIRFIVVILLFCLLTPLAAEPMFGTRLLRERLETRLKQAASQEPTAAASPAESIPDSTLVAPTQLSPYLSYIKGHVDGYKKMTQLENRVGTIILSFIPLVGQFTIYNAGKTPRIIPDNVVDVNYQQGYKVGHNRAVAMSSPGLTIEMIAMYGFSLFVLIFAVSVIRAV